MPNRSSWIPVLALLASCVEALEASGGGGGPPDLEADATSTLASVSRVAKRGVDLTPDILTDWGNKKQLAQSIVANHTLVVRYCKTHFPPGSRALANLQAALKAYSAVPGVAIDITDIDAANGTESGHPDLDTYELPSDAIYVDYGELPEGAYAGTSLRACDEASSPHQCTKARILITKAAPQFLDPLSDTDVTSVGVFMHEIGHAFGLSHINEADDSSMRLVPADMWFDRTTIHGWKTEGTDFRSDLVHAGTLGFLLTYYPDPVATGLETDEIVVHRNMSTVDGATHVEWNPAKTYIRGLARAAIADYNETRLRWNAADNTFEPCSNYGTLPRWFGRMSETSTNTTNIPFDAVFEVTRNDANTAWTEVASQALDSVGTHDLRQIDWDRTFRISLADVGLTSAPTSVIDRKLRFRADARNVLAERNESNNEWAVNVCLYPASDTACSRACVQPSSPGNGHDEDVVD